MRDALHQQFGSIDIYLFDQLLRGRITRGMRVLDAGCGAGRNLVYLVRNGFDLTALDRDPEALAAVAAMATAQGAPLPTDRLVEAAIEQMPLEDGAFDAVLCNAVLHFARDDAHFDAMVAELGRVLAPGGLLFARLASSIGIEERVEPRGAGRYGLPDGSERYLVNEARLLAATAQLGGRLLDPLKTTNVQGQRCMTTWVLRTDGIAKADPIA